MPASAGGEREKVSGGAVNPLPLPLGTLAMGERAVIRGLGGGLVCVTLGDILGCWGWGPANLGTTLPPCPGSCRETEANPP